jgi:hypothetical protein
VRLIKGLGEQLKRFFGKWLAFVVLVCSFALMMMGLQIRDNANSYTAHSLLARSLELLGNAQILVGMVCLVWVMWQPRE